MALLLIGLDTSTEGRVLSRRCGCATGACASTFSHRAELRVTTDEPVFPGKAAPNDARIPGIAKLKLAALVGIGILWLLWLRRAYRNLALVGSKRSRFTSRQA